MTSLRTTEGRRVHLLLLIFLTVTSYSGRAVLRSISERYINVVLASTEHPNVYQVQAGSRTKAKIPSDANVHAVFES